MIDENKALQYKDRAWSEIDFKLSFEANEEWDDAVDRQGWSKFQTLGDAEGLGVDLYERKHGVAVPPGAPLFFAEYNTSGVCKTVILPRWQDLIDFLAHVSSTMLAAILPPDASMILHDLCERSPKRIEDCQRQERQERERRRKRERTHEEMRGRSEWFRQIEALTPGDVCEYRFPQRDPNAQWIPGVVVRNGGPEWWKIRDASGKVMSCIDIEYVRLPAQTEAWPQEDLGDQ